MDQTQVDPALTTIVFGGLQRGVSELLMQPHQSPDCLNTVVERGNILKSRLGYTELDEQPSAGTERIDGLVSLTQLSLSKQYLYAAKGGNIYGLDLDAGSAWDLLTTEVSGLSVTDGAPLRAAQALDEDDNEALYIVTGQDAPLIVVADTLEAWPAGVYSETVSQRGYPAAWEDDWPSGLCIIGGGKHTRMMAWGFAGDPQRIDYSELGRPWNFLKRNIEFATAEDAPENTAVDGGYFYCFSGDGDPVMDVRQFFGYIAVIKRRKVVLYNGIVPFLEIAASVPIGAASARSVVVVDNDIYLWSEDGPRLVRPTDAYGDIATDSIRLPIIDKATAVVGQHMDSIVAYHDRTNHRIVWICPYAGNDDNDYAFVFNYELGEWHMWNGAFCELGDAEVVPQMDTASSPIYGGTQDGKIVQLQVGHMDGEDEIFCRYVTKWFQLVPTEAVGIKRLVAIFGQSGGSAGSQIYFGKDFEAGFVAVAANVGAIGGNYEGLWDYSTWDDTMIWDADSQVALDYVVDEHAHMYRFKIECDDEVGFELVALQPTIIRRGKA